MRERLLIMASMIGQPSRPEKLLGRRVTANDTIEYLVKMSGLSYSNSPWLTESEVNSFGIFGIK